MGTGMILGQVSYLDCIAFLVFLIPQLFSHIGLWTSIKFLLQALPHLGKIYRRDLAGEEEKRKKDNTKTLLVIQLPYQLIHERFFNPTEAQSPFVQQATCFQDIVIRCVRYAFANMPAKFGVVFLSKGVALPFMHFRMLRHGYLRCPIHWREICKVCRMLPSMHPIQAKDVP